MHKCNTFLVYLLLAVHRIECLYLMGERETLLNGIVRVKLQSNGQNFINGISSSYDDTYPSNLVGIVSEDDIKDIVGRLNDTIQSYWPCNACYIFGFVCSPFTLGTSLLCPGYCISQSDEHAQSMLLNVSLKAKYYDRKIKFQIVKNFCNSYVEISFPSALLQVDPDTENGLPDAASVVRSVVKTVPAGIKTMVATMQRSKDL